MHMPPNEAPLFDRPATELVAAMRDGSLAVGDVVAAHLDRIAALDPALAAWITIDGEAARATAAALDGLPPARRGPLHGLPVGVKDLIDTAGPVTTQGSILYADRLPIRDDLVVARLRAAGAVILGKTNTPEFGMGAVCTNRICGPTRNPFDLALTSGGSSGGSAVAVATGMAAAALGTDFGGSVRTPSSFCGTVAVRPTPGRLPSPTRALGADTTATQGVMGRSVDDCFLLLDALAGPHPHDPTSAIVDRPAVEAPRVAVSVDLGVAPVAEAVRARFAEAVDALAAVLGPVVRATPDCTGAVEAFKTIRAAHVRHAYGSLADRFGDRLTPTVAWNIAAGAGLSAEAYLAAEAQRTALRRRFADFFAEHDLLITPAASVLPWPNADGEVVAIDGRPLGDVLDYLAITFVVSLTGHPVLSLPAPQGDYALPFGLQIVARPGEEETLRLVGRRLEAAGFRHRWPPLLGPPAPPIP